LRALPPFARGPVPCFRAGTGPMAEWLRRGLQILARRFDSGSGLHFLALRQLRGRALAVKGRSSAALAQLVEHIIRNDGVTCSSHVSGTIPPSTRCIPAPHRALIFH
jgi:hypothetical protein